MANLEQLKMNVDGLRIIVLEIYRESGVSLLQLSKDAGVPYTTFRSYLLGKGLSDKNMFKIKKWVDTII